MMGIFNNLQGKKFGRLTVLSRAENKGPHARWACLCECGMPAFAKSPELVSGRKKSCGCLLREVRLALSAKLNVVRAGDRYGRLTVVSRSENRGDRTRWLCQCECGVQRVFSTNNLRTKRSTSCGCSLKTHGGTAHRHLAYSSWTSMIQRCTNPKAAGYHLYGGRGIKVCERWLASYADFLADMGHRPSLKHSIDRIDNDGNYEPGNCRWATSAEQSRNLRTNRLITYKGETKCLTDWAIKYGLNVNTLRGRLRRGVSVELALTLPVPKGPAS